MWSRNWSATIALAAVISVAIIETAESSTPGIRVKHRRLADDAHASLFSSLLWWDTCHEISAGQEYETKSSFLFMAILDVMFNNHMWGACSDHCSDLCRSDDCFAFAMSGDGSKCTCGSFICHQNASCIEDASCACNNGFQGNGKVCCNTSSTIYKNGACAKVSDVVNVTRATFLEGSTELTESSMLVQHPEHGHFYTVEYNLTTAEGGLISLNSIASFLSLVECWTNGTNGSIHIVVDSDSLEIKNSVDEMYPLDSYFILSRDIFGLCYRDGEDEAEETFDHLEEELEAINRRRSYELKDYYLRIKEVSGTVYDAVLQGEPAHFFELFPEGTMDVQLDTDNEPAGRELSTGIDLSIQPDGSLQGSASAQVELLKGTVKIQIRGTIKERGILGGFHPRWSFQNGDFSLAISFTQDTEVILDVIPWLSVKSEYEETSFLPKALSYPLFGLPNIDLNAPIDSTGDYGGFSLKFAAGVYLELPLILKRKVELNKYLEPKFEISYKTGRIEHDYTLTGPWYAPIMGPAGLVLMDIEDRTVWSKDPVTGETGASFGYNVTGTSLSDLSLTKGMTVSVDVFAGIRPQVAVRFPFLDKPVARASADIGVGFLMSTALEAFAAIDQEDNPKIYGWLSGDCDTCHYIELAAYASAQNVGIFFALDDFDQKLGVDLTYKIATMCFAPLEPEDCPLGPCNCPETLELPDPDAARPCNEYCYEKHCEDRCGGHSFCLANCFTYLPFIFCEDLCERPVPDPSTCVGECYQTHCIERCRCSDPYCFCHSNCFTYMPYIICEARCE